MLNTAPFTVSAKEAGATYENSVELELLSDCGDSVLLELPGTLEFELSEMSVFEVPSPVPELCDDISLRNSPEDNDPGRLSDETDSPGEFPSPSIDDSLFAAEMSSFDDSEQPHIPTAKYTAKTPEK